jgi:hypothetical protein
LAFVQIQARTVGEFTFENMSAPCFGQLARGFLCRKSENGWQILLSSNGLEKLIDVVGNLSAETGSPEREMQAPSLLSPADGTRSTRFPLPNISWKTCDAPDAAYFIESQFSSPGSTTWSESWFSKAEAAPEGDVMTIQAPFGIGAQPHRWRVWAISGHGRVSFSEWRTIIYNH